MAAAPAAAAIGGATPFAWAQMGLGLLGGAAKPAGPSSADALFGSSMFNVDSSNWMINFGDGAEQSLTTGDKQGPSMTVPSSYAKTPTAGTDVGSILPFLSGGGGSGGPATYPGTLPGGAAAQQGTIAGIPVLWIVLGLGALVLWKKR